MFGPSIDGGDPGAGHGDPADDGQGWRPMRRARRLDVDWDAAFPRLALVHLLSVSGETLVVLSLAGSFFFKVDPAQGREKVILGLLFTMAPFALVGPLIGPVIDRVRGGHRAVIRATMLLRVVTAVAMTIAVANDSVALFPEAFAMLVLAKTYQIAKAAVVPTTVAGDLELVEANSKLQLLSGLAAVVAGGLGGALLQIGGEWVLGLTTIVFTAATVAAMGLHPSVVGAAEERQVRDGPPPADLAVGPVAGVGVGPVVGAADDADERLAVSGFVMGSLRAVVGLLTFLLAFELRGENRASPLDVLVHWTLVAYRQVDLGLTTSVPPLGEGPPAWWFGVVIVGSVVGGLVGSIVAPVVRRHMTEERILLSACVLGVGVGLGGLLLSGLIAFSLLSFGIAVVAALGKQAFDAVVQRDVPELDRGRVFARYEARFQMTWVLGALVPSILHLPIGVGAVLIAVLSAMAAGAQLTGTRLVVVEWAPDRRRLRRPYVSRSGKSGISGSSSSSGSA